MANGDPLGTWKNALIGGLWAMLLLFAAWAYADSRSARAEAAATDLRLSQQVQEDRERIATLEEAMRGMRESLARIESGVNELRGHK